MADYIAKDFLPVKIHIKEQPAVFGRFGARWTPTLLVLDSDGVERHRLQGFLPADDLLAQLELGLAHSAFARQQWAQAEQHYRQVVAQFPKTEAAPEALYWAGVSKYKATNDPAALRNTAQQFKEKYTGTSWATKASVWAG